MSDLLGGDRRRMSISILFCSQTQDKRRQNKDEHPFLFGSKNEPMHQLILNTPRRLQKQNRRPSRPASAGSNDQNSNGKVALAASLSAAHALSDYHRGAQDGERGRTVIPPFGIATGRSADLPIEANVTLIKLA